ncbi:MAG: hypothetical protein ACRYFU_25970 [Janthinobacterium lividum]
MNSTLGYSYIITAARLREMSHAAFAYVAAGWTTHPVDAAYVLLTVIRLRGQTHSPSTTTDNLILLHKVYEGTQHRISPEGIAEMLQSAGKMALTMSDQGIIDMAAYMSVKAKQAGH